MLSKAIKIYLNSSRVASSRLPKAYLCCTNVNLPFNTKFIPQIYARTPQWNFSTTKENIKNDTNTTEEKASSTEAQQDSQQQKAEPVEEIIKEDFVQFMQKEPNPADIIFDYDRKVIYETEVPVEEYKNKAKFNKKMAFFWGAASYLTYSYLNPFYAIVPGLLFAGALALLQVSSSFSNKLVQKVVLVDNYHVKVYPLSMEGQDIICRISETNVLGIQPMNPEAKNQDTGRSFLILVNFEDAIQKKKYENMRLIVDPKLTSIENIDLLKSILYGRDDLVARFRFLGNETFEDPTKGEEKPIDEEDEFAEFKKKVVENKKPEDKK